MKSLHTHRTYPCNINLKLRNRTEIELKIEINKIRNDITSAPNVMTIHVIRYKNITSSSGIEKNTNLNPSRDHKKRKPSHYSHNCRLGYLLDDNSNNPIEIKVNK